VIRNGVLSHTRSYWDVIVQPGRVWTDAGDDGWHRASFPFALVSSIEGQTHTGIGLFAYRGHEVSPLRFQVVQRTAAFDVPEHFDAWGSSPTSFSPGIPGVEQLRQAHRAADAVRLPVRPWSELTQYADPTALDAFVAMRATR